MKFKLINGSLNYNKGLLNLMMRTFIVLFCTSVFSFNTSNGFSQNAKIVIDSDTLISVPDIFTLIEDQTDYQFIYDVNLIKDAPKVVLKKGIIRAGKLLKVVLEPIACTFEFTDNTLIVKKKTNLNAEVPVQDIFTIKGTVKDKNGIPVVGASVFVASNEPSGNAARSRDFITRGTATDFDGNFTIDASLNYFLAVSAIGYEFTYRQITTRQEFYEIVLNESVSKLDEVVVVGYGTTVKKDLTGSVGTVKAKEIQQIKSQTVDQALVGQIPGVFVESNSGAPGSGASVNIRGLSQINGDNQPLYVVDGVPIVVNTNFGTFAGAGNRENPLLTIDPNTIERIDVLKDASSAAIYGSRAANGVVLITTKKGRTNQASKFNFSYNTTLLRPTIKLDYLNANQYRQFATDLAQTRIDNATAGTTELAIINDPDNFFGSVDTDWQDEILNNTAIWNQYNFSVSGGTRKATYFVSASVNDQDGLFLGNTFKRYNFSTNIDTQITANFKAGGAISYTYSVNRQSGLSSLFFANFRPELPVFDADGNPSSVIPFPNRLRINPVENQGMIKDKAIAQNAFGSVYGELELVKNVKFRSQLGIGLTNDKSAVFSPSFTSPALLAELRGGPGGAILENQITAGYTTTFTNTLTYNGTINEHHSINAVAGVSWDHAFLNFETQDYAGFPDDFLLTDVNSAGSVTDFGSSAIESGLNSIFGRINYNFKDRYLVTFTARSDGSTKFGPENRRGFFPSGALAWNIHNEDFLGENHPISQLKLRASLGRTGTDNLPAFSYLPFYATLGQGLLYDGVNGIAVTNVPNPAIKWETTDQLDIGLEFGVFNGRLNGEVVYFEKNTSGLILLVPVPSETGSQNFNANIADVSNTGWEFSLGADVIRADNFRWNTSLNISFIKNNVDALNGGVNSALFGLNGIAEGEPIGFINGFEVASVAQTQQEIDDLNASAPSGAYYNFLSQPGDYIFRDLNGDGEITDDDRTNLGDINPDYFGGWNNSITYKNFSLAFNLQFVQGNDRRWAIPGRLRAVNLQENHIPIVFDTWRPDNTNATYARIGSNSHLETNSRDVYSGSYVRLRFLTLSFTLPQDLVNEIGLTSARLSLSGNNLFTITDYPGQDPENVNTALGGSTIARRDDLGFSYPQAKTFTLGIDLSF